MGPGHGCRHDHLGVAMLACDATAAGGLPPSWDTGELADPAGSIRPCRLYEHGYRHLGRASAASGRRGGSRVRLAIWLDRAHAYAARVPDASWPSPRVALGQDRRAQQTTDEERCRERDRPADDDPNSRPQDRTAAEVAAGCAGDRQGNQHGGKRCRNANRGGKQDDRQNWQQPADQKGDGRGVRGSPRADDVVLIDVEFGVQMRRQGVGRGQLLGYLTCGLRTQSLS